MNAAGHGKRLASFVRGTNTGMAHRGRWTCANTEYVSPLKATRLSSVLQPLSISCACLHPQRVENRCRHTWFHARLRKAVVSCWAALDHMKELDCADAGGESVLLRRLDVASRRARAGSKLQLDHGWCPVFIPLRECVALLMLDKDFSPTHNAGRSSAGTTGETLYVILCFWFNTGRVHDPTKKLFRGLETVEHGH